MDKIVRILRSPNKLHSYFPVRLVDEASLQSHGVVVVLQPVGLQHLDGENVALQVSKPEQRGHM